MPDRQIVVLPTELVQTIDANRGDISRDSFIQLLIDSHLEGAGSEATTASNPEYVTPGDLSEFEEGIRELLKHFLEFFLSYGLVLGKNGGDEDLESLTKKLKSK